METILMWLGVAVVPLYMLSLVGGPMFLVDWLRRRRQETIRRQIALTDAIDGQLGPIVSPLVRKPLWGPWQVRIAMPVAGSAALGRILAIAQEVFSGGDQMNPGRYQIVLMTKPDPTRRERESHVNHPAARWPGDTIIATR